jgi:hypothetical protein
MANAIRAGVKGAALRITVMSDKAAHVQAAKVTAACFAVRFIMLNAS